MEITRWRVSILRDHTNLLIKLATGLPRDLRWPTWVFLQHAGRFDRCSSYHEQSLFVAREIGNPYYEIYTLINLSALAGIQNDAHLALEYAKQAELLSQKTSERVGEALGALYMGHAYLLQGELGLAQPAYHKSIEIRQ